MNGDSFGVQYVLKEIKEFLDSKSILTIAYRIQGNDSKMCGYFLILG